MVGREDAGAGMLRVKFFRLRALRPGESGRRGFVSCGEGMGNVSRNSSSSSVLLLLLLVLLILCGVIVFRRGAIEVGDSGEELGEVSVADGESNVEMVVVGDESVDSDATDDMLCRCWKGRVLGCNSLGCSFGVCDGLSAVNDSTLSSLLPSREPDDPDPNTDMKDGNETGTDGEFAGACILDGEIDIDLRFDGTLRGGRPGSSTGCANIDM